MDKSNFEFKLCMDGFLEHLIRNCYSNETIKGYKKDLQYFEKYMSSKLNQTNFDVGDVKKDHLLQFMDHGRGRGHKTNTIARRISTLKSFYKFIVFELDYPIDLAARIKIPKTYIPLPKILSQSEVHLLLNKAKELSFSYQLLFSVLYYTGSRLTPVRTLEVQHVSLTDGIIYFPKVKGGKDLYLPIHDNLRMLFKKFFANKLSEENKFMFQSIKIPNQPLSAADVRKKLKIAASMAGIESNVTPHLLRHCTATHLTINNVEQRKIANILGHSDLRSTIRYQHLSVDHLKDSINSL